VCVSCLDGLEAAIRELPKDVHDLGAAIGERGGCTADAFKSPNKPESKPPINLFIDALRSRIVYTASVWEEVVREHAQLSPGRTGGMREGYSIVQSVRILAPRTDLLIALPPTDGYFDGVDGAGRLHRLHTLVREVLGYDVPVIRVPGICPCGAATLRRQHGSDTVWCETCEHRMPLSAYWKQVQMAGEGAA
jgi:hypothetical protein